MYDILIIGSGPAGLGAAIYGVRAGLMVMVLEKAPMSGGQLLSTDSVDNYLGLPGIGGFELAQTFRAHADKLGVTFREAVVTGIEDAGEIKKVHTAKEVLETRCVILATGCKRAELGVVGEEAFKGRGVSYCATCDGAFYKGKTVAVVGGGDAALEDAAYLSRFCEKVYIIHRRDTFRAAESLQEALRACRNVEILWNRRVTEIGGQDGVEYLLLETTQQTKKSQTKEENKEKLSVNGVFAAVGTTPNTELLQGLAECDEKGYILADETCATTASGIFAAGDVRQKPAKQIITAVSDGANAAICANKFLKQFTNLK